jgi:hypothetical protein
MIVEFANKFPIYGGELLLPGAYASSRFGYKIDQYNEVASGPVGVFHLGFDGRFHGHFRQRSAAPDMGQYCKARGSSAGR